ACLLTTAPLKRNSYLTLPLSFVAPRVTSTVIFHLVLAVGVWLGACSTALNGVAADALAGSASTATVTSAATGTRPALDGRARRSKTAFPPSLPVDSRNRRWRIL